jgi:DNA topoisomerase VI subunit B
MINDNNELLAWLSSIKRMTQKQNKSKHVYKYLDNKFKKIYELYEIVANELYEIVATMLDSCV